MEAPAEAAGRPQSATPAAPQVVTGGPAAEASGADDPVSATTAAEGPRPPAGGDSVGWLFARIRADREQAVSWAQEVLAEEHPVADGDEALLQRRDRAVDSIESDLTRRLKRSLQDDQNNVLDRLRSLRPSQRAADVALPSGDAHSARFRDASKPFLREALAAGAAFTASLVPGAKAPDNPTGAADQAADALAAAVLEPLRRRLGEVLAAGDGDDPVVLAEAVGAAYREWKTKRVEVAASDAVAEAFAQGAYAATPAGTDLRWLVCDVDGPCPDCDDNALAGEQPKGEPFPTGQLHPPAHPGCRCVLVAHPH
jgi:hypothetical protein